MRPWLSTPLPLALLVVFACDGDKDGDTGTDTGSTDADTDTDTNPDTDADTDTDTDTDTDADTDTDTDTDTAWDTGADTGGSPWVGAAVTVDNGDGTFTTEVDATDPTGWTTLDLATGAVVAVADPTTSTDWDLAFRRDAIAANSGVSGPGAVDVAALDGVPFEDLAWPAAGGYAVDLPDADADLVPEYAFAGWYDYDYVTHQLTPADRTWTVHDRHGAAFRIRFDGYYDAAGVSGHPTFTWAPLVEVGPLTGITGADGSFEATVAAVDPAAPVHLRLAGPAAVAPADPVTGDAWDLAFARTVVTVGGGASGAGGVEVAILPGEDYELLVQAPASGYTTDADTDGDGVTDQLALGDWYDYDSVTHAITPKDEVYVVRTSAGTFKLQLLSYDDGTITARWAPVAP